jgi:hypothetical protein
MDRDEMPERIKRLPLDPKGRPVPWFVHWLEDGTCDFRVIGPDKIVTAYRDHVCWICGQKLGVHMAFVIGPMCSVNRISAEPPSHLDCALYAAKACPFLSTPKMHRREGGYAEPIKQAPGIMIPHNPGVTLVYVTREYHPINAGNGIIFKLGLPVSTKWFCEGRPATRLEVLDSIDKGLPVLMDLAISQGDKAVTELKRQKLLAMTLLPLE